jgi:Sugar phosphate isomerases/epimerases
MSKPKVGVSMLYSLGEPFNRMVKRLGDMDTKYIEILDDGTHDLNKTRIAQLREAAKSYDLTYSVHAPFADINIGSPAKPMLAAGLKRLKQSLANANGVDAKMWVFHPAQFTGISPFYPDGLFKQSCESIKELYAIAEDYGINMALENLPEKYGFLMSTPAEFQRFYKETNLPIGITLDLGHANLQGQIQPFFDQIADKIVHVHASNNYGEQDEHNGVEDGNIDYNQFAQGLKRIGYDKWVMVESIKKVPESIAKLKQLLA